MRKDKKQDILDSARALFARYGMAKTTIDDIVRESRVARSTVYSYFSSKEDIFREVIEQEGRMLFFEIDRTLAEARDAADKLRRYTRARMCFIRDLHALYTVLTDDNHGQYPFIERARKQYLEKEIETIVAILDEGVDDGLFNVEDTELAAYTIISAWKGLDLPWTETVSRRDPERCVENLLAILFDGIMKQ